MKLIETGSPEETISLAANIAKQLQPGDFIALEGDLGAGKTVFAKGIAAGLGVKDPEHVNSPSFVIIKEYKGGRLDLYHFDVYRLEQESFMDTVDYKEYFYGTGVTVVEWADKITGAFPEEYIRVRIEHAGPEKRNIQIDVKGEKYRKLNI